MTPTAVSRWSSTDAARLAGVTLRQLDHWVSHGFVRPPVGPAGPGSRTSFDLEAVRGMAVFAEFMRVLFDARRCPIWADVAGMVDGGGVVWWDPTARSVITASRADTAVVVNVDAVLARVDERLGGR